MSQASDAARYTVLRKMSQIGTPMNLLEIGFNATPQLIRNMAARGMVRVTVELTEGGKEVLAKEVAKRHRAAVNAEKDQRKLAAAMAAVRLG